MGRVSVPYFYPGTHTVISIKYKEGARRERLIWHIPIFQCHTFYPRGAPRQEPSAPELVLLHNCFHVTIFPVTLFTVAIFQVTILQVIILLVAIFQFIIFLVVIFQFATFQVAILLLYFLPDTKSTILL